MLDVHPHVEFLRKKNLKMTQAEVALQTSRRDHSIARLNEIHARYPTIQHGDFLFQLVLFVNEPIFWINKFGYRKLDRLEINVCSLFYQLNLFYPISHTVLLNFHFTILFYGIRM